MNKKNLAVIFGGCSPEHDISVVSASMVFSFISEEKYNVIPIYITKDGRWFMYDGRPENIAHVKWDKLGTRAVISPECGGVLLRIVDNKVKTIPIDLAFPLIHGPTGEDGALFGLLELAQIPYVGFSPMGAALSFDKVMTKQTAQSLGINQAQYIVIERADYEQSKASAETVFKEIRYKIGYPCYIKPARGGSSIGVSRPENKKSLKEAIEHAFVFDDKIIAEKEIKGAEVECAVLAIGKYNLRASAVGQIVCERGFYDFKAKYVTSEAKILIPANIPEKAAEEIREISKKIFSALDGSSFARVDFFYDEKNDAVYFNEINSIPGFTPISMFAKLWEYDGLPPAALVEFLAETARLKYNSGMG